jgi:YidC/Oxa1 family membrane protein insertase
MLGFLDAAVGVAYHIVTGLSHALTPLAGPLAAAAAIVVFTLAVRLLLLPLGYYALRGQLAQARLAPQVQELRKRHARDSERLQRELTALYQREGGGLLLGCLPLLAQLPFFSVMYRLFLSPVVSGHANGLLARNLLGVPLRTRWVSVHFSGLHWSTLHWPVLHWPVLHWLAGFGAGVSASYPVGVLVFAGLFALLGVVGWASARTAAAVAGPAGPARGTGVLARLLPYTTVVIALFVPLAAGLYLLTTTAWTVAERAALRGRAQQANGAAAGASGAAPRGRELT